MMRVALIAGNLAREGGIARYCRELLAALGRRDDVALIVVAPPEADAVLERLAPPNLAAFVPLGGRGQLGRALWEQHRLDRLLDAYDADIVHSTNHLLPRTARPTVLTVHDVFILTWPQQYARLKRALLPTQFRAAVRAATAVISVSHTTGDQLAALEPTAGAKTVVIEHALPTGLTTVTPEPVAALGDTRFALTVGDLSPRKNVDLLLDVWPAVHSATGLVLVIVGGAGWRSTATQRRVEGVAVTGTVHWLRDLPDAELRWCYEHAVTALIPTFDEGYGIPMIESLAFGCPVLASTAPALVEVAHGYAQHLSPDDATAWRDAIVDTAEAPRRPRVCLGLPSWDENAARTVATYEHACALSRGLGREHA